MSDEADAATKKFDKLCQKYVYPATLNTKDELIEFWSAGIAAGSESPRDIGNLERISNRMQEGARNSVLYAGCPALEEINDDLLGFEDMDSLSEDEEASIADWHSFMDALIERTKTAIKY